MDGFLNGLKKFVQFVFGAVVLLVVVAVIANAVNHKNAQSASCTGTDCNTSAGNNSNAPAPTSADGALVSDWKMQWFDSQHHVGITGTAVLDQTTGAQANLTMTCWGGASPSLKVGVGNANLDIASKTDVHDDSYYDWVQGRTIPKVYTTQSQSLDVAIMLDSQYSAYTVTPDTANSFILDGKIYSTQQLLGAGSFKVIFGANGKRQIVIANPRDDDFAKFLSECDAANRAANQAANEQAQADQRVAEAQAQEQIRQARLSNRQVGASITTEPEPPGGCDVLPVTKAFTVMAGDFDPDNPNATGTNRQSTVAPGGTALIEKIHQDANGVDDWYMIKYVGTLEQSYGDGTLNRRSVDVSFEGWITRDSLNDAAQVSCVGH
jgi:hypothetical protein